MDVHHHPHVEKKNFKEYFLEFLMIFLAVTLGFFAENIREDITEHTKEKQLVSMLADDLISDTAKLNKTITYQTAKLCSIDTLRLLVFKASEEQLPDSLYKKMYYIFNAYAYTASPFQPTNRALSQLDKSDAFSFISKQIVSDSILLYKENSEHIESLFSLFREYYQLKALELGQSIFDGSMLEDYLTHDEDSLVLQSPLKFNLLTSDRNTLLLYGTKLRYCRIALAIYIENLKRHKQSATTLINLIQKEYHLKIE